MTLAKFAASMAIFLALIAPAVAAIVDAAVAVPYGPGIGWRAYRKPEAYPPQRPLDPRLSGLYGPYWSGEQNEHVSPHK